MSRAEELAETYERKTLGFWIYLMTDCVLFAALFATYAVLKGGTAGGPGGAELFDLPFVLLETIVLLTSSFTIGMALLATVRGLRKQTPVWLFVTFALGIFFLALEFSEFAILIAEGNGPQRSAFLSAYFTLVATHGIHIAVGLLWMAVVIVRLWRHAFKQTDIRRLALLGIFWHFLDIIWIFIFSIVYLIGASA
jgi:cytochrome o ubiquinol oxidase subunit 3